MKIYQSISQCLYTLVFPWLRGNGDREGNKRSMEMVEKEVEIEDNKKMNNHQRGGIRTLPFIFGELTHFLFKLIPWF